MTSNHSNQTDQFGYVIDTDKKNITLSPLPKNLMHFDITDCIDYWPFDSIAMLMNHEVDAHPDRIHGILWGLVGEQDVVTTRQDFIDMHCYFEYEKCASPEINGRKPFTLICYDGSTFQMRLSKAEFNSLLESVLAVHQKIRDAKGSGFNPMYPVPLRRQLNKDEAKAVLTSRESIRAKVDCIIYGYISVVILALLLLVVQLGSESVYFYALCAGIVTHCYVAIRFIKIRRDSSLLTQEEKSLYDSMQSNPH